MRFFSMDLHISVIADFKNLFPDIEVIDWCLSGHSWVMNRAQDKPEIINADTWKKLNWPMIHSFQHQYDDFLSQFDGFIVGHVAAFALIYEKYQKPIIMINTVRVDLPFCWSNDLHMREELVSCLKRLNEKKLLIPISNNLADQLYTLKATGIKTEHIPSLCLYTGMNYQADKKEFLCYNGKAPKHRLIAKRPQHFKWKDIAQYRGMIYFPYEVSTMSMFEHFSAGLPMFFPSKTLFKKTINSFWERNYKLQSISAYWKKLPDNLKAMKDLTRWLDLADFYEVFKSPNLIYFDSENDLFRKIENFDYVDDRETRQEYINNTKKKWAMNINKIYTG